MNTCIHALSVFVYLIGICDAGHEYDVSRDACGQCKDGWYKESRGTAACSYCTPPKTTTLGATQCSGISVGEGCIGSENGIYL